MASRLEVLLACANGELGLPELSVIEMDSLRYRVTREIELKPCKMKSIVEVAAHPEVSRVFPLFILPLFQDLSCSYTSKGNWNVVLFFL